MMKQACDHHVSICQQEASPSVHSAARHRCVMPSAYHDASSGSIERGNALGDRSTVRQSRYFRQYESGARRTPNLF